MVGRRMIATIIVYLIIALIVAALVIFGYYTFNYHPGIPKMEVAAEYIKAIAYGMLWPLWLVLSIIDEIKDLL